MRPHALTSVRKRRWLALKRAQRWRLKNERKRFRRWKKNEENGSAWQIRPLVFRRPGIAVAGAGVALALEEQEHVSDAGNAQEVGSVSRFDRCIFGDLASIWRARA